MAEKMTLTPHIMLEGLDDASSRELFLSCNFRGGRRQKLDDDSQKKDGSQMIIHNCKGVPSILNSAHSFFRDCARTERDVQHLQRMYCHLPERMKRCIAYCSLFPENHQVDRDYLIRLWIAEGFIHHDSDKSLDEIGSEYFNNLWNKSFFRFMPTSQNFEIPPPGFWYSPPSECYKRECGDKPCIVVSSSDNQSQNQQQEISTVHVTSAKSHIRIHLSVLPMPLSDNYNSLAADVRHSSFVVTNSYVNMASIEDTTKFVFSMLYKMEYLRSLDLSCTDLEELPEDFGRLIHLNFLGLNSTLIKILPDSICMLYKLHTLELRNCKNLEGLPKDIGFMISLTHLDINKNLTTFCMPTGIGKLTELQTLRRFNVGRHEKSAGINELSGLNYLTDELCISGLCNVVSIKDCMSANLEGKKVIRHLTLAWFPYVADSEEAEPSDHHGFIKSTSNKQKLVGDMEVLENLKPHDKLKSLTIHSYDGSEFPKWMEDPKFEVHILELEKCNNKDLHIPSFGLLPALEYLTMDSMFLKKIGLEFCHVGNYQDECFPVLRELEFKNLYEWEEWSEVSKDAFPMLRKVTFFNCPKLEKIPCLNCPKLHTLEIENCGGLKTLPEVCTTEDLHLILTACDGIEEIPTPKATLTELTVRYCSRLLSLPKFSTLENLKNLHLEDCENLISKDLDLFLREDHDSLSSGIVLNCPQLEFNVYMGEKNQIILEKNGVDFSKNETSDLSYFVEGQEVHLLSPDDINLRVAWGRVTDIRQTDEVGGTKLGKRFVGVCVEEIIQPNEELIRPYAQYYTIEDASGATIAWKRRCLQLI